MLTLSSLLSKKLLLIMGCQRSGTTLAYMMLSSHPKVWGKDESESRFSFPSATALLLGGLMGKRVCYKLPTEVYAIELIRKYYASAEIIWIVRNPYAVVSSMRNLLISKRNGETKNWLLRDFPHTGKKELKKLATLFPEIKDDAVDELDEISLGASIAEYKVRAMDKYEEAGFKVHCLKYEDLVANPEKVLAKLCKKIGLNYDKRMLRFQDYHKGKKYAGQNEGGRQLDKARLAPKISLNEKEKAIIKKICRHAVKFNYQAL